MRRYCLCCLTLLLENYENACQACRSRSAVTVRVRVKTLPLDCILPFSESDWLEDWLSVSEGTDPSSLSVSAARFRFFWKVPRHNEQKQANCYNGWTYGQTVLSFLAYWVRHIKNWNLVFLCYRLWMSANIAIGDNFSTPTFGTLKVDWLDDLDGLLL